MGPAVVSFVVTCWESRIDAPLQVLGDCACHTADDRDIASLLHIIADFLGDQAHCLKVIRRGNWESCFNNINTQLGQLLGNAELLLAGQGGPRRLLSVSEGCVKDTNVLRVCYLVGYVLWPLLVRPDVVCPEDIQQQTAPTSWFQLQAANNGTQLLDGL